MLFLWGSLSRWSGFRAAPFSLPGLADKILNGHTLAAVQHHVLRVFLYLRQVQDTVNANQKLSIFAETKCKFSPDSTDVYTALQYNPTCQLEARQALIYQLALGLTGENGKYNYSKAVHVYSPFSYITCSAKNYKIALALTENGFQI